MHSLGKKKKTTCIIKSKQAIIKESTFLHDTVTTLIYRVKVQDHKKKKLLIALHSIHQVHIVTF